MTVNMFSISKETNYQGTFLAIRIDSRISRTMATDVGRTVKNFCAVETIDSVATNPHYYEFRVKPKKGVSFATLQSVITRFLKSFDFHTGENNIDQYPEYIKAMPTYYHIFYQATIYGGNDIEGHIDDILDIDNCLDQQVLDAIKNHESLLFNGDNIITMGRIKIFMSHDTYSNLTESQIGTIVGRYSDSLFTDVTNQVLRQLETKYKSIKQLKQPMDDNKPTLFFISHSSKDKEYAEALVDLLKNIGLTPQNLFCTSVPGYWIENGRFIDVIKEKFDNYNLYMIIIQSPRYFQSPISLNEMGAAWALGAKCSSFLTNDMTFEQMNGVINKDYIAIDINSTECKSRINDFKKEVINYTNIPAVEDNIWERERNKFIETVKEIKYDSESQNSQNVLVDKNIENKITHFFIVNDRKEFDLTTIARTLCNDRHISDYDVYKTLRYSSHFGSNTFDNNTTYYLREG